MQPVAPQSLVKPSGRLEREAAPDLGLAGAAQLGIKLGSQSKPVTAPASTPTPSAKPSSHRSQGHHSTSGRQAVHQSPLLNKLRLLLALFNKCFQGIPPVL